MWSLSKNFAYDTTATVAIDLGFSPDTYWPTSPTREQLLARIKGQIRRNVARHIIEEKGLVGLTSLLGRPSLTEAELDQWGSSGINLRFACADLCEFPASYDNDRVPD